MASRGCCFGIVAGIVEDGNDIEVVATEVVVDDDNAVGMEALVDK